jgi:DNA-binding NtrC family response regulator
MTLKDLEKHYITLIVTQEGGRVYEAARKLGMPKSSLYHKLKEYGISPVDCRQDTRAHGNGSESIDAALLPEP